MRDASSVTVWSTRILAKITFLNSDVRFVLMLVIIDCLRKHGQTKLNLFVRKSVSIIPGRHYDFARIELADGTRLGVPNH